MFSFCILDYCIFQLCYFIFIILYYIMCYYIILYYTILSFITLYYIVLYYIILCFITLYYIIILLYYYIIIHYFIIIYYIVILYYYIIILSYYIVLYCIVLYCAISYRNIMLYYIVWTHFRKQNPTKRTFCKEAASFFYGDLPSRSSRVVQWAEPRAQGLLSWIDKMFISSQISQNGKAPGPSSSNDRCHMVKAPSSDIVREAIKEDQENSTNLSCTLLHPHSYEAMDDPVRIYPPLEQSLLLEFLHLPCCSSFLSCVSAAVGNMVAHGKPSPQTRFIVTFNGSA